jgi:hypothetical protein
MVRSPALTQAVRLRLTEPDLDVVSVTFANLSEAVNQHAALAGQVRYRGGLAAGLKAVNSRVTMEVVLGGKPVRVFEGEVDEIDASDGELSLRAFGASRSRDEAVRTASYGGAPDPKPIHQLAGMESLLKGVGGGDKLTTPVAQVYQYYQTDFTKLVELAGLHRLFVLAPGVGSISLADGSTGPLKKLAPDLIVPRSERVTVRRRAATVDCLTWNPHTGGVPARAATGKVDGNGAGLLADLVRDIVRGKGAAARKHQLFPAACGTELSDGARADRLTQAGAGRLVRWRGRLRGAAAGIGVGQRLRLKDHPIEDELLVVARDLTYRPGAAPAWGQLVNAVECTPVAFPPFDGPAGAAGPVIPLLGQVSDVKDPKHLARVKVTYPWHARRGARTAWEGVWAYTCQNAGGSEGGKAHGAVELPRPLDWVLTLVDPAGFEPPLVLTTIYHGQPGAPRLRDPERERVLLWTAGGIRLLADDGGAGRPASVKLAVLSADGKEQARLVLSADGTVTIVGKTLELEGKGRVSGSLDTVRPKGGTA